MTEQEDITIQFAKRLANTSKTIRDKTLKKVQEWICRQPQIELEDMKKIWMGIYQDYWMSDKYENQHELALRISEIITAPQNPSFSILYVKCGFWIINKEWDSIDRHRIDKFLKLSDVMIGSCISFLSKFGWNEDIVDSFVEDVFDQELIQQALTFPNSLLQYITENLLKTIWDKSPNIPWSSLFALIRPFFTYALHTHDDVAFKQICDNIIDPLIIPIERVIQPLQQKLPYEVDWRVCLFLGRSEICNMGITDKVEKEANKQDEKEDKQKRKEKENEKQNNDSDESQEGDGVIYSIPVSKELSEDVVNILVESCTSSKTSKSKKDSSQSSSSTSVQSQKQHSYDSDFYGPIFSVHYVELAAFIRLVLNTPENKYTSRGKKYIKNIHSRISEGINGLKQDEDYILKELKEDNTEQNDKEEDDDDEEDEEEIELLDIEDIDDDVEDEDELDSEDQEEDDDEEDDDEEEEQSNTDNDNEISGSDEALIINDDDISLNKKINKKQSLIKIHPAQQAENYHKNRNGKKKENQIREKSGQKNNQQSMFGKQPQKRKRNNGRKFQNQKMKGKQKPINKKKGFNKRKRARYE
ncbi:MAG: hypothetical protein EZS28_002878 [Streblomastix strix]|uniref:Uncharacterized protein n=1 Tax=Streblomastix strix TaxID=222440 RepID=A0A5J4X2Z2_9EUKA|nr:MAG: hypothetical protein EZS28_002878 [Streblomastix strix]